MIDVTTWKKVVNAILRRNETYFKAVFIFLSVRIRRSSKISAQLNQEQQLRGIL